MISVLSLIIFLAVIAVLRDRDNSPKQSGQSRRNIGNTRKIGSIEHSSSASRSQVEDYNSRFRRWINRFNYDEDTELALKRRLLELGFKDTAVYHNLYIYLGNDCYSQVDIVVATEVGIIVIEDKNYGGWIFGNGMHEQWTQVMAYGSEKYRFYNPIKQNQQHIKHLRELSEQLNNIPFYSIVVFSGNATLKQIDNIPPRTYVIYKSQLEKTIGQIIISNPHCIYKNKWEIVRLLSEAAKNGLNPIIVENHKRRVSQKYGS